MSSNTNQDVKGAVMVVGSGIAGMQAALDLADSGFYVHVVEKSPLLADKVAARTSEGLNTVVLKILEVVKTTTEDHITDMNHMNEMEAKGVKDKGVIEDSNNTEIKTCDLNSI